MDAAHDPSTADRGATRLSELYDEAVTEVYRYLRARTGSQTEAEELTSATFVQAALTLEREPDRLLTIGWLVTVARSRLIDRWRRQAVAERSLTLLEGGRNEPVGPWDAVLDQARATQVLAMLPPHHRAVLTLRYLDDLSVPECAEILGKSIHATESLLARARNTFRTAYEQTGGHDV